MTGIPEDLNVRRENGGADNEHTADASPAGRYFVVNLTRDEAGVAVADEARDTDFVQSLQRGLAVIRAFDAARPSLTLSEVARSTGLARAAARRFLLTLVDLGYMRVEDRRFRLTPRVLELGHAYLSSLTLPELALPHMRDFVAEIRESSSLCVLDGHNVVYVARVPSDRIMSVSISVGTRFPAFATSLGRVLLGGQDDDRLEAYLREADLTPLTARTMTDTDRLRAEIQRVRRQGWALVDQELEEGVRALAVPIHGADDGVAAALNASVHASRWTIEAVRHQLLPSLLETARAIDRDAGAAARP